MMDWKIWLLNSRPHIADSAAELWSITAATPETPNIFLWKNLKFWGPHCRSAGGYIYKLERVIPGSCLDALWLYDVCILTPLPSPVSSPWGQNYLLAEDPQFLPHCSSPDEVWPVLPNKKMKGKKLSSGNEDLQRP